MLTVLHLAPKLSTGGTGALAADLARELELSGQAHNIIMAPGTQRIAGLPFISIPATGTALFSRAVLRRFLHQTEVNVIIAYTELAAWVAGRVCSKLPPSKRPRIVGALTAYPHKHLLGSGWKYCQAFSAVSRHLRTEWENFSAYIRSKKAWVIPYGTRETQCFPGYHPPQAWKNTWNNSFATTNNQLALCLPAPITPVHGHETLVALLSSLHRNNISPRVFLVGDYTKSPPRYPVHLKELFHKAQLDNDIVWLGARTDLRDILCACDITISLDKQPASYNRPIQEALCLGRPVVGYDHGVVGELLSAFLPEGRVAPDQVEAMADTITQWNFYRPATVESIPYPYRLTDTADSYMKLFETLRA